MLRDFAALMCVTQLMKAFIIRQRAKSRKNFQIYIISIIYVYVCTENDQF